MSKTVISPVLKWAGGKTQLLEQITANIPKEYNNYYEPFLGGGAVLFNLLPHKACVSDINEQLINLYSQLKYSVDSVIDKVHELDAIPCSDKIYYEIRSTYNIKIKNRELDAECAAFMIWINKHCFNGLYRVNKKGLFNVPYNNKINGSSIDENNLRGISDYFQNNNIQISCIDFEIACKNVSKNDFVYLDSPYIPISETASFTDYTMNGFLPSDHERLASLFRKLDAVGAKLMLSNNDVPLVHSLYAGYNIQTLCVKRNINRNADKRTGTEVLITNY